MAVTRNEVAELYVSFFDRAVDADGLDYWENSGLTIEEISGSFFDQTETQEKYPESLSNADFVNTIYENVFNHAADADGLVYWVAELDAGTITRANMILAISNGALGEDQLTLDNKTTVGLSFADAGLNDADQAIDVMSGVNSDPASVIAAEEKIADLTSLDLTPGVDTIVGTENDDTINGTQTTYTLGDSVEGGAGEDTMSFKITAGLVDPVATINNVENISIANTFGVTFDASN